MRMTDCLYKHNGCVNHISFNSTGELLVSGSDDTHVGVWNLGLENKNVHQLKTGHTLNIFCVRFMPSTGDSAIASCSADGSVRVTDVTAQKTTTFRCHQDRVKKFVTQPGDPNLIRSCGEDGLVFEIDRRQPEAEARLLAVLWEEMSIKAEANSICSPAHKPHLLAVAGSDGRVRLYDRRMTREGPLAAKESTALASVLVRPHPPHFAWPGNPITGIACTASGDHIAVNLLNDNVYLLDTNDLERHSQRQASQRKRPERRSRRRRQPQNDSLPSVREVMHLMDEHHAQHPLQNGDQWWQPNRRYLPEASAAGDRAEAPFLPPGLLGSIPPSSRGTVAEQLVEESLSMSSLNEHESALRFATTAVALAPRAGRTHYALAVAACAVGDLQCAHSAVNTALSFSWSAELDALKARLVSQLLNAVAEPAASSQDEEAAPSSCMDAREPDASTAGMSDWEVDDDGDFEVLSGMEDDDTDESWEDDEERGHTPAWYPGDQECPWLFHWADGFSTTPHFHRAHWPRQPPVVGVEVGTAEDAAAAARDWRIRGHGCMPAEPATCTSATEDFDPGHSSEQCWSMRYGGHINKETVKDVSFVGPHDEVVAAGSDNGCMYLWDRRTGRLLAALRGDGCIVNCIAGHPHEPVLASCGIDDSVKLWAPQFTGISRHSIQRHLLQHVES
ncbi:hypothetical protein WJX73_000111 [Symbiochloris irregularis]|uniref:Uncharacterized protein n=1 Tax=Symbiochloris irregularis TaxID=706552 RepID=A0AAW1NKF0_9CHLO